MFNSDHEAFDNEFDWTFYYYLSHLVRIIVFLVHLGKTKKSYWQCLVLNANGLISNVSLDCSVL